MSQHIDFPLGRYEDGTITVTMSPPTAVGGWQTRFQAQKRLGGISGFAIKWSSSGYCNNESGVTLVNSGQGIWSIAINSADSSGLDYGNYAYAYEKLSSGSRTGLVDGYWMVMPGTTP